MFDRWLHARHLARINDHIAPGVATDAVNVLTSSITSWIATLGAAVLGLAAGVALDTLLGTADGKFPLGAVALAGLAALLALPAFSANFVFIDTEGDVVLFASSTAFRGDVIDVIAELVPPLDYEMSPRIISHRIAWRDRTLWVTRRDAGLFRAIASGQSSSG